MEIYSHLCTASGRRKGSAVPKQFGFYISKALAAFVVRLLLRAGVPWSAADLVAGHVQLVLQGAVILWQVLASSDACG